MFYSEDPESFFGGESEYGNEGVTETRGNEFGSGGRISDIGRDIPGADNGGVIEGGADPAGSGDSIETGEGIAEGSLSGQAEEEEASLLVEEEEGKEELVDYIVSVIERIEEENLEAAQEESIEDSSVSSDAETESANGSETPNDSLYTIDDIYTVLEEIKTCCITIQEDNKSYHVGQDITGRMLVAVLFMILGGIVIYAFVGRIR